jgi:hypothetical protein
MVCLRTSPDASVCHPGVHPCRCLYGLPGTCRRRMCVPEYPCTCVGRKARTTSPAGPARKPTCTGASPWGESVGSSALHQAGCGSPVGLAQSGCRWLSPALARSRGPSPPITATWVWPAPGAPGESSCGQDRKKVRQAEGRPSHSLPLQTLLDLLSPEDVPIVVDGPGEAPGL